jgi:hypothetical protein
VPAASKQKVVADLIAAVLDPDADPALLVQCASLLLLLDRTQYDGNQAHVMGFLGQTNRRQDQPDDLLALPSIAGRRR